MIYKTNLKRIIDLFVTLFYEYFHFYQKKSIKIFLSLIKCSRNIKIKMTKNQSDKKYAFNLKIKSDTDNQKRKNKIFYY